MQDDSIRTIAGDEAPGSPLSPWTYSSTELFELEYEALYVRRWQLAGHVNDVAEPGDYCTADIGRDNILIVRDGDGEIGAFLNVCRHRASRVLEGAGNCGGNIRCPYHGWTYGLNGDLKGVPQQKDFPEFDRADSGLHPVQVEVFNGLIFVRIAGEGPSVADYFGHTTEIFEKYDVANYERIFEPLDEIWDVNWKLVWDNYLENYHIPVGHPGLHRLVVENDEHQDLANGVTYGTFLIRENLSSVAEERAYQQQIHHADQRVPEELRGRWVQFSVEPNLGIDLYPEMLDVFQAIPLSPNKTLVRTLFYGHKNPTAEEVEVRRLNRLINDSITEEDRLLCERVQKGLQTHAYSPGPLSSQESLVFAFHEMVRETLPVAALKQAPATGSLMAENERLKALGKG